MNDPVDFDVIVVGAGPAGLACACALADRKVLILEREKTHGGRVHSIELGSQRVDMGACFAFDHSAVPAGLSVDSGRMIEERSDLAVHDGQRIYTAATPLGCLLRMGVDTETLAEIETVARLETAPPQGRSARARALLDALLHQVHPGDWLDYAPRHQRDGLFSWYPDHWERGNGSLVDAMLEHSSADLRTGAEVTRVADRFDHVEVGFTRDGESRWVRGRAVVVATPADVARRLVDGVDSRLQHFLDATRYAGYVVVAMAGRAASSLASFRNLIPLGGTPAVVVQQRSRDRDRAVLLSFLRGPDLPELAARSDAELVELCRSALAALGLDPLALDALDTRAVQRWPHGGTVLSNEYLEARTAVQSFRAGSMVFAGDYACDGSGAGYGVSDALRSGRRAAEDVRAALAREAIGPKPRKT